MRAVLACGCLVSLAIVGINSTAYVALAQSPALHATQPVEPDTLTPKSKKAKRIRRSSTGWRVSPSIKVNAEYDNNIFLLTPNKKDNVTAPTSADITSGRYSDMKAPDDVLTTMSASLTVQGPGLLGKSSSIAPEVSYDLYAQNTQRSNLTLGLSLQQEVWGDGRFRVRGRLTPSYFARNYLADALDQDANGSISEGERVYAAGEYREGELGADYRVSLVKSSRKRPLGAALQLGGGYYSRSYVAPFNGRDLHGPTMGAKLLLDLGRRLDLDLGYDYSSQAATESAQIVLLDEFEFNQDFNGNGTTTDLDTRVTALVDRSRNEHSLGATLRFELSKPIDVVLGYEHRWRRYTSDQPLDVSNRGRKDARHQLAGDFRVRLAKDLRLRLGGVHTSQSLNRTGDPGSTGEIDDYSRSQARLGLAYEL